MHIIYAIYVFWGATIESSRGKSKVQLNDNLWNSICIYAYIYACSRQEREREGEREYAAAAVINCALQSRQRKCRQLAHTHTYILIKFTMNWDFTYTKKKKNTHSHTHMHMHKWHTPAYLHWRPFKPTQLGQFFERVCSLSFPSEPPAFPCSLLRIFSFHFWVATGFLFKNIICWLLAPIRGVLAKSYPAEPTIFLPHFSCVHTHTRAKAAVCVCVCAKQNEKKL